VSTALPALSERSPTLLWGICFVAVLGAHVIAATALFNQRDMIDDPEGAPAVTLDLAAVAAAPSTQQDDRTPGPLKELVPETTPPAPPQPVEQDVHPQEQPQQLAEVSLPKKEEQTPEPRPIEEQVATPESAPVATATQAPVATSSTPGKISSNSRARIAKWEGQLFAHLQRSMRYPSDARSRSHTGRGTVSFNLDRQGYVSNVKIVDSSGSKLLDQATVETIARAQPWPLPPPDLGEKDIFDVTVPFGYYLR
jgi:periplasmic protein TonB